MGQKVMEEFAKSYSSTIALLSAIATSASAFLTYKYVKLTRKTFEEIKKQTDHMTLPYISIQPTLQAIPNGESANLPLEAQNLYTKWETIVRNADADAVTASTPMGIRIKNIGKSDAINCKAVVWGKVSPREKLIQLNTKHEDFRYIVPIQDLPPNTELHVPIGHSGTFPAIEYNVHVTFSDITQKNLETRDTINHKFENLLI